MNPQFKIESVEVDWRLRAYVRAAIVNPKDFVVTAGSRLGGVYISPEELREPKLGVFIFRLEDSSDATKLHTGDTVTLEARKPNP